VNGVLFRDTDGRIYLADAVSENDGELWNMEEAEHRRPFRLVWWDACISVYTRPGRRLRHTVKRYSQSDISAGQERERP
jgi:hypothetical protein